MFIFSFPDLKKSRNKMLSFLIILYYYFSLLLLSLVDSTLTVGGRLSVFFFALLPMATLFDVKKGKNAGTEKARLPGR